MKKQVLRASTCPLLADEECDVVFHSSFFLEGSDDCVWSSRDADSPKTVAIGSRGNDQIWSNACLGMRRGELRRLTLSADSKLAATCSKVVSMDLPGNSVIFLDLEILEIRQNLPDIEIKQMSPQNHSGHEPKANLLFMHGKSFSQIF